MNLKSGIMLFLRKAKNRILYEKMHYNLWRYLTFPLGKKIYIIGAPLHGNLGDSAIALAQKIFIGKTISENRIKEIAKNEYREERKFIRRCINKRAMICCHGGGNIGNQWYDEELFRYDLLSNFKNNKIVIFPQTIWFTHDASGDSALALSREKYNAGLDLTMIAREEQSYQCMLKNYNCSNILLTPDIVLSSTIEDYGVSAQDRSGALLVFRNDPEKALQKETEESIIQLLENNRIAYKRTDTYSKEGLTKETRLKRVQEKLLEFLSSEIVFTDRVHGMIFAAITETPCIVFSNYNYKVSGTYEWIKHLPYISYIDQTDDIVSVFNKLIKMKSCKFDNNSIIEKFDCLLEVIKEYVN